VVDPVRILTRPREELLGGAMRKERNNSDRPASIRKKNGGEGKVHRRIEADNDQPGPVKKSGSKKNMAGIKTLYGWDLQKNFVSRRGIGFVSGGAQPTSGRHGYEESNSVRKTRKACDTGGINRKLRSGANRGSTARAADSKSVSGELELSPLRARKSHQTALDGGEVRGRNR